MPQTQLRFAEQPRDALVEIAQVLRIDKLREALIKAELCGFGILLLLF